jgi:hypothetical protein
MRQSISKTKPWEACGISRATWYRRGKPEPFQSTPELDALAASIKESLPNGLPDLGEALRKEWRVSRRTVERAFRVLNADPALFHTVERDGAKGWALAERVIRNPDWHREWREENGLPWPVPKDD